MHGDKAQWHPERRRANQAAANVSINPRRPRDCEKLNIKFILNSHVAVDLAQLPIPQLRDLKTQLDAELTHLSNSFQSLRTAQAKFKDCIASLTTAFPAATPATAPTLLVPLTSSLYVPGRLTDHEHVLVDVGTGFFVEKGIPDAKDFYERKVKDLGESLKDLEVVVEGKARNVRLVEEVMRVKVLNAQSYEGKEGSA
ncbi:subunit of tubulin prefoldin [Pleosporales sp. CAS-2024a]